jgi:YfaZ precursor
MRGPIRWLFGALFAISGAFIHAQESPSPAKRWADLAISDKTLDLRYTVPTKLGGQPESAVSYAVFLSEERDFVASAKLLIGTELNFGWEPLHIQFGPQAYAVLLNEENNDVFSLAVGLDVRYDLMPSRGIALRGYAYFAPDILTFGAANQASDFMVRAEIGATERLIVFGGYRWFRLDMLQAEQRNLQNELFAGVRWQVH